ncbi:lytic transglycosylase domain-containing protein [Acidithiobacillus thiooxidans]|uniref:lytic transglycosylase domain-containing protein n=1 Tax=Acidithiobacillus thiooxidans TaxID=930 RepID=UPI002854C13E|nr:lytic transglycosylase domain-containing protein [Acidithiobacillus thiooxidans]MDR7925755.1 lytic transglycosylase domain-containing protein [Acidithiobacillus thiooxidans]
MIGLQLLQECAPQVAPVTMAAVVQTESGGNPLVIHDNTTNRSYFPKTRRDAERILHLLLAAGHQVDAGIAQVDSENFAAYGLNYKNVFDPCTNLQVASKILVDSWKASGKKLPGALQVYNSGKPSGDARYARIVYHQAGVSVPSIPGGKLAAWAVEPVVYKGNGKKETEAGEPVRIRISWTPAASPIQPKW